MPDIDLTHPELDAIAAKHWPRTVPTEALRQMLRDAGDLALAKYLGTYEPPEVTPVTHSLHITGLPPSQDDWPFDPQDLSISTYAPPDQGAWFAGPNRGVRIKHLPSGLEASAHEERSQHRNKVDAMRALANLVRQWKEAGSLVPDPDDPFPEKTDTELGFAYRMMLKAHRGGLNVNFVNGDISLPNIKR